MMFILINIFYLFSNSFHIISGEKITENPIEIIQTSYSLVFNSNVDSYNIVTLGKILVIDKSTREEEKSIPFEVDIPPIAFLKIESNDHRLFAGNDYYIFSIDENDYEIQSIAGKTKIGEGFDLNALYDSGIDCYGFFAEKEDSTNYYPLVGKKVKMYSDELVLYAIYENIVYFFYFQSNILFSVESNFDGYENHISCKLVNSSEYVCTLTQNNQIKIFIFIFNYITDLTKGITCIKNLDINAYSDHDLSVLNDIPEINEKKILCARKKNTNKIDCIMVKITIEEEDDSSPESIIHYHSSVENNNLNEYYEFLSFQMDNCYFTGFYGEYLFCCGRESKIPCSRFGQNFDVINNFEIIAEGSNSNLNIINNKDYASLFYINTISGISKLYEYFIYPPKCQNISIELIVTYTLKKNINEFFVRKENLKYYLILLELPLELGTIKLNDNTIETNDFGIDIDNNNQIFYFIPNEILKEQKTSIIYKIYQETYSAICEINITVVQCYHSCKNCSLSIRSSGEDNHNCLDCKENYFPFSRNRNNCYNETEGRSHTDWYFDNVNRIFDECNGACLTCSGPTENNCLSCPSEEGNILYLYNGKCFNVCPEHTYPDKNENNQYICNECYTNCKTRNETGIPTKMLCTSCFDYDIKFGNNCYRIHDEENKLFYNPENNEITSCKEYKELYIKDDGNECIPKPDYHYFISNDATGLLSSCDPNCITCYGKATETSKNCIKCSGTGLYSQDGNCVRECSESYFSDNANLICIKCHKNCLTCNTSPLYNPQDNLISMGCSSCNDSFIFVKISTSEFDGFCFPKIVYEENKITFDISEYDSANTEGSCFYFQKSIFYGNNSCSEKPPRTYYKINNEHNTGIIEYCNIACSSCDKREEEGNTNCIDCSNGYFKTEYSNTNCLLESSIPNNYYKNNLDNIYYKCHSNCANCTGGYNIETENMNCINCISGYYFIHGTHNCYDESLLESNEYYLTSSIFFRCYNTCSKCFNSLPSEENHYCKECANNYYKLENGSYPNNCYDNETINKWKIIEERKTEKVEEISNSENLIVCPRDKFITPDNDCASSSPNGTYKFFLNNSCLKYCPHNYKINENNECEFNNFDEKTTISEFKTQFLSNMTSYVNSSKVINGTNFIAVVLSSEEMDPEEQIKKGISAVNLGNCTKVLKERYNISSEENLIVLNMEIKNADNKKNESINRNDNSFNLGKTTQIEVYDYSGRKLDLSFCKDDIQVMKYIGDVEELNIQSAKDLANQGIDVFNASDEFFNDICHQYDNTEGKDVILEDRRTDIYQNATFCQDGCSYKGMNYDLMVANCICDSSYLQSNMENMTNNEEESEAISFKSLTKSFLANLLSFNFDVIRCYNLVINSKNLKTNIGFYCLSSMFLLQIIFLIVYLVKKLKSLKNFMLIYKNKNIENNKKNSKKKIKSTPPPKNKKSIFSPLDNDFENANNNNNNNKKYLKNKLNKLKKEKNDNFFGVNDNNTTSRKKILCENNFNSKKEINKELENNLFNLSKLYKNKKNSKEKFIFSSNFGKTINIQNPVLNINNNNFVKGNDLNENKKRKKLKPKKLKKELTLDNNNKDKIYNKQRPSKKNKLRKNIYHIETIQEGKIENFNSITKISQTDSDLQDMDYEEAIIYDKRSYFRMYWAFLVDSQIILGTFCTDNYLNLFVIKLSFFICTFQISFFLNALFYTDEYISDAYHNDGVLDFFSGLPKSIYSFIATLITTNLLRMLSSSRSELMKVIRERKNFKNYVRIINQKLSKLRKKLIIYFILVFMLNLLFLYYVTSFCAVYKNSQKYWFYGCLESFAMDTLVAIIICIFISLFRYISIKNRIKCFYVLANLISTFL